MRGDLAPRHLRTQTIYRELQYVRICQRVDHQGQAAEGPCAQRRSQEVKSSYHEEARYSQVGNFIVEHKLNSRDQARQPRKQVQPLHMHRA